MLNVFLGVMLLQPPTSLPEGLWLQSGYGTILEIKKNEVKQYDVSKKHCVFASALPTGAFIDQFGPLDSWSLGGRTLELKSPTTTYKFSRIERLPKNLIDPGVKLAEGQLFDLAWQTLVENYAFTKERGVNWARLRSEKLNDIAKGKSAFEALSEFAVSIKDGHTTVSQGELSSRDAEGPAREQAAEKKMRRSLVSLFTNRTLFDGDVKRTCEGRVAYGKLMNGVGYIAIFSMGGFSKSDPSLVSEHRALRESLTLALSGFDESKGVVIDLRSNSGGYDSLSLDILSAFSSFPTPLWKKRYFYRGRYSAWQKPMMPRFMNPFRGKVVVLISKNTISGGESCALGFHGLENARLLGQPTRGIFSDALEKHFPGGLTLTLSNEMYEDLKGRNYEVVGVPPDILTAPSEDLSGDILFAGSILERPWSKIRT